MPIYNRKPTRIPNYDYTSHNYYFITICTHNKECIFGKAAALNQYGQLAAQYMEKVEQIFPGVKVDNYVIMPNHIHAIIILGERSGKKPNLSTVIGQYKMVITKEIRRECPEMKVWQRSFHDHIIRNQSDYERIWEYVEYNPQKWENDCFYCE